MPLTKHYLRYVHAATLGIVNGRKSNLQLTEDGLEKGRGRRALVVAPAVEDVVIWDPRRGDKVTGARPVCVLCVAGPARTLR